MLYQKKPFKILILIIMEVSNLYCQENSLYLNSYLNPFITNAGSTGQEYYPVVNFSVKRTLLDFPDAPSTYLISGNIRLGRREFYDSKYFLNKGALKLSDRIGLGAAIFHDNNGPLSNTGGIISYAYHISVNKENNLSLGLSVLFANYSCNRAVLRPSQNNDEYLYSGNSNLFNLNAGFGAFYYTKNYFGGLSINKILPGITNAGEKSRIKPSYFASGGYKFYGVNNWAFLEPSIEIKKLPDKKLIVDIHGKIYFKRLNWMAVSVSTLKLINFQLALRIYKMTYIGYNYGCPINQIARYNYGIHEITIGLNLGLTGIEGIRETH